MKTGKKTKHNLVLAFCSLLLCASPSARAQFGEKIQYFPQFAIGGGAETFITICNQQDSSITVSVRLRRSDGSLFLSHEVSADPQATETLVLGGEAGTPANGWVELSSESRFAATLFYRIPGVGNVGVAPSAKASQAKIFAFVEGGTDTGFAAANPSETEESVLIFQIFNSAGRFLGEATITLPPLGHTARFLTEPPWSLTEDGSVLVAASQPIVAVSLRTDDELLASTPVVTPMTVETGSITTEALADGAVTNSKIEDGAVTAEKIAAGQVVRSLNGLADDVTLVPGSNIAITPSGNSLTVSAMSSPGDITGVRAGAGLSGGGTSGEVTLSIPEGAITGDLISDGAVGSSQLAEQVSFGAGGSFGEVALLNGAGSSALLLTTEDGSGTVVALNSSGLEVSALGTVGTDGGGFVGVADKTGTVLVLSMKPNDTGAGSISASNASGAQIVGVTSDAMGNGFISVNDSSGAQTAGINGATGEVFGALKSFRVQDPQSPDRMIRYTSLEGPEAAMYVRGTAELSNGRALVEFPDHFAAMAVPSSVTLTLTPRSASSLGLALVGVNGRGFEVAELIGGKGNYRFDYVAYAVRRGFENYRVYVEKDRKDGTVDQGAASESGGLVGFLQRRRKKAPKN